MTATPMWVWIPRPAGCSLGGSQGPCFLRTTETPVSGRRAHRGTLHRPGRFPMLGVSGEPSLGPAPFPIPRTTICVSELLCEGFGILDSFLNRTHW